MAPTFKTQLNHINAISTTNHRQVYLAGRLTTRPDGPAWPQAERVDDQNDLGPAAHRLFFQLFELNPITKPQCLSTAGSSFKAKPINNVRTI
jgi:hypothetical protein